MTGIRPMERRDVPDVARLYEVVVRKGRPEPELAGFLERTTFDQPWVDPRSRPSSTNMRVVWPVF